MLLVLVASTAACNSSSKRTFDDDNGGDAGGTLTSEGGVDTLRECAEDTKDVFVISAENSLYQFHPPTLEFKSLGTLNCPTNGATPTSMAVDRTGIAWVRHSDGSIWKVSTVDRACQPTNFAPPLHSFTKFGMGFASETAGSSNEALFLSDSEGGGLGKLDLSTLAVRSIGNYTGDLLGKPAELTGTGEGKLYGFFATSPAQVAEISKGTGEIVSAKVLTEVNAGDAWAFSFYGGDFYIYTNAINGAGPPLGGGGSDVTRYRPSDGSVQVVKSKVGFKIVGAGVSTCAPTSLPK
ncbi:hypothetical protein [Labilithrix luteola]|uniref:hypothetical protein n=1 Tax=Labilithrix luteola TaxID=1391654 RepID=UPI0011BACA53|nr:hypothetical protein [Labilithrix luteola]